MISKKIMWFGRPCTLACDGLCNKAWGINARPRVQFDDNDPDDYAFLADGELGDAPADPGTYEGGHGKPCSDASKPNKWCARECERSRIFEAGEKVEPPDFSRRQFNKPSSEPKDPSKE